MKKLLLLLLASIITLCYVAYAFINSFILPKEEKLRKNEFYLNGKLHFATYICLESHCIDTIRWYSVYRYGSYRHKYGPKTDCYCDKYQLDTIALE